MKDVVNLVSNLSFFQNPTDIVPINGGITNVNVSVTDGDKKYVVRIGNDIPEHGVMRWNELALSKAAQSLGVSPAVVHFEPGILVLEFIEAQTFKEADVRAPKKSYAGYKLGGENSSGNRTVFKYADPYFLAFSGKSILHVETRVRWVALLFRNLPN